MDGAQQLAVTGSLSGAAQPPCSKPPRSSSSGLPGACMTPSSERWLSTVMVRMTAPCRRCSIGCPGSARGPGRETRRGHAMRSIPAVSVCSSAGVATPALPRPSSRLAAPADAGRQCRDASKAARCPTARSSVLTARQRAARDGIPLAGIVGSAPVSPARKPMRDHATQSGGGQSRAGRERRTARARPSEWLRQRRPPRPQARAPDEAPPASPDDSRRSTRQVRRSRQTARPSRRSPE